MLDYKKILVALDFSPAAKTVVECAKRVAERYQAALILAHVVEYLPPIDLGYDPLVFPAWDADEQQLLVYAEEQLQRFAERFELKDAQRIVLLGTTKSDLVCVAQEQHCDLIIIGSHGRHGIGLLLGSTTNAVLHHARCDVLAVRIKEE